MAGLIRKVIRVRAVDSPNVRLGLAQEARGEEPTNQIIVPGVLSYAEYVKRRQVWDKVQQCVSLDGEFYEGGEVLLFPPAWLDAAEDLARRLRAQQASGGRPRRAKAIGCDPAEGGDKSAWVVGDELGVIEVLSLKTPNTNDVPAHTLRLMNKYGVDARNVAFDRGGGGKQHADRLRASGYDVRTVAFGESLTPDPRRGATSFGDRVDAREERYAYVSRRAEMYDLLSRQLDPDLNPRGFALPPWVPELRRQLAPIPRLYDKESRMRIPPKSRPASGPGSKEVCLIDLIGHSPDEADALVLMTYALLRPQPRSTAGVI